MAPPMTWPLGAHTLPAYLFPNGRTHPRPFSCQKGAQSAIQDLWFPTLPSIMAHAKHGTKLWNSFLRYGGAVGIAELRGTRLAFRLAMPISHVLVHSALTDAGVQSVINKFLGRWLSGAPRLLVHSATV
jgi:hypothetical protein